MKVSVWDTYVTRNDGRIMHFDILVPDTITDENAVFNYGKEYLKTKSVTPQNLSAKECRFCHMEIASNEIEKTIDSNGYAIIEMENCD